MGYRLRPASESDLDFLYALRVATMRDVIDRTWGWDEAWQRTEFDAKVGTYIVSIIESDSRPAGTVWLEWTPDALHVHELQVLPEFQGRGLGTAVLQHVIALGADRGFPVALSVVPANARAQRLYERLGFKVTGIDPPFICMRNDAGLLGAV